MQSINTRKPLAIALGAAFALTGAMAHASVFQTSSLNSGYMVASAGDKAGEAKCGEKKAGEAKCGEKKVGEAKCGEKGSNCEKGAKAGECMCGASKGKKADGKCGEAKCGNKK